MDNEQNQNTVPETQPSPEQTPAPETPVTAPESGEESGTGPIVGSIIVILVIVAGGIYFWLDRANSIEKFEALLNTEVPVTDETVSDLEDVNPSDDIEAIESDLAGTDLDNLDEELGDIDALLSTDLDNL